MPWSLQSLQSPSGQGVSRNFLTMLKPLDSAEITPTILDEFVPVIAAASTLPSLTFANNMTALGNFRFQNDSNREIVVDMLFIGALTHNGLSGSAARNFSFTLGIWDGAVFVPDANVGTVSLAWGGLAAATTNSVLAENITIPPNALVALMVRRDSAQNLRIQRTSLTVTERV